MATDVSVVIAYRDMGCPHRRAAFDYVYGWYRHLGVPIIVESGGADDGGFTRASAINTAVRRAASPIIIQSDPDSLVGVAWLRRAAHLAAGADGLVIPHNRYLYLTRETTADLFGEAGAAFGSYEAEHCDTIGADGSGNVVVFSRNTWETVRGFDERFPLWGGDDAAFAYAAEAFFGPARRLDGDMIHLWHPRLPQSEPGAPGYGEQFAILAQYRDAAAVGPEAVRELVAAR